MNIDRLDWDSTFFGLRIGRVTINTIEDGCLLASQYSTIKKDYDLLYVFAPHGFSFSASGARLIDEKVTYTLHDNHTTPQDSNIILWDSQWGVTDDLRHLALVSGEYSRFKLDDRLPNGSYERLYSRWIEQSVNHAIATDVFCYLMDGVPKGLVTLNHKNGIGDIGLVAVHEDYHYRGIGTTLMQHAIHYPKEKNIQKLSVVTQLANVPACRLYEKNGFTIESISDVWHWWL